MNADTKDWLIAIGAVVLILAAVLLPLMFLEPTDFSGPQRKCEAAGGIYFAGGFGASNCAFPPQEAL